jgi:hypothetical protein
VDGLARGASEGAYVFVCYSHDDAAYVERLSEYLRAHDVDIWYDQHLEHGVLWRQEIERRILAAAAVVVVMTPSAKASREVQGEVDLALDRGTPVLGLLLDGDVWYQLKPLQYEDVTGSRLPSPAFVSQLRRYLGPPVPPPEMWERSDILDVLASRDIGQLFRLVQSTTGGTPAQIGALTGLSAAEVDEITHGARTVTSVDQLARIATGLEMPESARTTLFLGQRAPAMATRTIPTQREPASRRYADVTAVYATRSAFTTAYPPHALFDRARRIDAMGLSLNILCQQYSDTGLYNLAASGTRMRLLLLDPDGESIKQREREEGYEPGHLSSLNVLNLGVLKRVRNRLPPEARDNLQIGLYDETIRFNVIIIDDRLCVAQPYLPHQRGVEAPTLVIERDPQRSGLYSTFEHVFISTWEGGRLL